MGEATSNPVLNDIHTIRNRSCEADMTIAGWNLEKFQTFEISKSSFEEKIPGKLLQELFYSCLWATKVDWGAGKKEGRQI